MVRSSTASTLATPANEPDCVQPVCSSVQYSQVKTASSAVMGVPSDQTRPSLRVQVMDIRSSATPPFSVVGPSAASAGTISVVGPKNRSKARRVGKGSGMRWSVEHEENVE